MPAGGIQPFCKCRVLSTSLDSYTTKHDGLITSSQSLSHPQVLYPLLLALTSFGGWCSVAQTQSMIAGTGLKLSSYIIQKLTAALAVSLLTFLYLKFL